MSEDKYAGRAITAEEQGGYIPPPVAHGQEMGSRTRKKIKGRRENQTAARRGKHPHKNDGLPT